QEPTDIAEASAVDLAKPEEDPATRASVTKTAEPNEDRTGREEKPVGTKTERIHGTIVLPDGTPLPGVRIKATRDASSHAIRSRADELGRFEIPGLVAGDYTLCLSKNEILPILGQPTFSTGEDAVRIEVNARLVTLRNMGANGEPAPLASIRFTNMLNPGFGSMKTFGSPKESLDRILLLSDHFVVRSTDSAGTDYFGIIEPTYAPGHSVLDLTPNCPSFGGLVLRIQQPALPSDAALILNSLIRNGDGYSIVTSPAKVHDGMIEFAVRGLLPGEYKLELELENASTVSLDTPEVELTIDAGSLHEVDLDTSIGGVLKILIHTSVQLDSRSFSRTEIRGREDTEWTPLWLRTTEKFDDGSSSVGSHFQALIGGPAGVSAPINPGHYVIRCSREGHRPEEISVQVVASEVELIEITLHPE
ncbi:MAG: carboxypeptidase regulatory-like domain-containing protein, partial [bacterium]|nr:carboxypeptidase regulatory-like domain-containing protein [bacterium]